MNIYYWSPFLNKVATVKAVINSAHSLIKFSSKKFNPIIINCIGEWNDLSVDIKELGINIINFKSPKNFYKSLPRFGFLKSRFSYIVIIYYTTFNLYHFLKNKKENDVVILHLLTSLPLLLINIFNFKCKFILRISGLPKLNLFRKYLWKKSNSKLAAITCPTIDTKYYLQKNNIFDEQKLSLLRDPVINISEIQKLKNDKIEKELLNKSYFIAVGRLTEQKNHNFLLNAFCELFKKNKDYSLIILGEGELNKYLTEKINKLGLSKYIKILGYRDNVYKYYKNAACFIQTSKWEDPGFVMIEAAASKLPILTCDCKNGPKEFINNGERGYIYENFNYKKINEKLFEFINDKNNKKFMLNNKILKAFIETKKYTKFSHYLNLQKILID